MSRLFFFFLNVVFGAKMGNLIASLHQELSNEELLDFKASMPEAVDIVHLPKLKSVVFYFTDASLRRTALEKLRKNSLIRTVEIEKPVKAVDFLGPKEDNLVRIAPVLREGEPPAADGTEEGMTATTTSTQPNDPDFDKQWGMGCTRCENDMNLKAAWTTYRKYKSVEKPVVVAVVDTGVDYNHPDLKDRMWVNPGEIPGNGIDDDGNGFVDDVYGVDVSEVCVSTYVCYPVNSGNPMDKNGHGTHCAGNINAEAYNAEGIVGVAGITGNVQIMAVKFLSDEGYGTEGAALVAMNYALTMGATISNHSWGGRGASMTFSLAVEQALAQGHLMVAAAGNESRSAHDMYPCSYPQKSMICVGATYAQYGGSGSIASFSNYGTEVDMVAPGEYIYSTTPEGQYQYLSGTSMATPMVAGAAALLASFRSNSLEDIGEKELVNVQDIRDILLETTEPLNQFDAGKALNGHLDAKAAIISTKNKFPRYENAAPEAYVMSLEFRDQDDMPGTLTGEVIANLSGTTDVEEVLLWFQNDKGRKVGSVIARATVTGTNKVGTQLNKQVIPATATRLMGETWAKGKGANDSFSNYLEFEDKGTPTQGPSSVETTVDTNPKKNFIDTSIQFPMASSESTLTSYEIYMAHEDNQKLVTDQLLQSVSATTKYQKPICEGWRCADVFIRENAPGDFYVANRDYKPNEALRMEVQGPALLQFEFLDTEACCDKLHIDDQLIAGRERSMVVSLEEARPYVILWSSDSNFEGFWGEGAGGWAFRYVFLNRTYKIPLAFELTGSSSLLAVIPKFGNSENRSLAVTTPMLADFDGTDDGGDNVSSTTTSSTTSTTNYSTSTTSTSTTAPTTPTTNLPTTTTSSSTTTPYYDDDENTTTPTTTTTPYYDDDENTTTPTTTTTTYYDDDENTTTPTTTTTYYDEVVPLPNNYKTQFVDMHLGEKMIEGILKIDAKDFSKDVNRFFHAAVVGFNGEYTEVKDLGRQSDPHFQIPPLNLTTRFPVEEYFFRVRASAKTMYFPVYDLKSVTKSTIMRVTQDRDQRDGFVDVDLEIFPSRDSFGLSSFFVQDFSNTEIASAELEKCEILKSLNVHKEMLHDFRPVCQSGCDFLKIDYEEATSQQPRYVISYDVKFEDIGEVLEDLSIYFPHAGDLYSSDNLINLEDGDQFDAMWFAGGADLRGLLSNTTGVAVPQCSEDAFLKLTLDTTTNWYFSDRKLQLVYHPNPVKVNLDIEDSSIEYKLVPRYYSNQMVDSSFRKIENIVDRESALVSCSGTHIICDVPWAYKDTKYTTANNSTTVPSNINCEMKEDDTGRKYFEVEKETCGAFRSFDLTQMKRIDTLILKPVYTSKDEKKAPEVHCQCQSDMFLDVEGDGKPLPEEEPTPDPLFSMILQNSLLEMKLYDNELYDNQNKNYQGLAIDASSSSESEERFAFEVTSNDLSDSIQVTSCLASDNMDDFSNAAVIIENSCPTPWFDWESHVDNLPEHQYRMSFKKFRLSSWFNPKGEVGSQMIYFRCEVALCEQRPCQVCPTQQGSSGMRELVTQQADRVVGLAIRVSEVVPLYQQPKKNENEVAAPTSTTEGSSRTDITVVKSSLSFPLLEKPSVESLKVVVKKSLEEMFVNADIEIISVTASLQSRNSSNKSRNLSSTITRNLSISYLIDVDYELHFPEYDEVLISEIATDLVDLASSETTLAKKFTDLLNTNFAGDFLIETLQFSEPVLILPAKNSVGAVLPAKNSVTTKKEEEKISSSSTVSDNNIIDNNKEDSNNNSIDQSSVEMMMIIVIVGGVVLLFGFILLCCLYRKLMKNKLPVVKTEDCDDVTSTKEASAAWVLPTSDSKVRTNVKLGPKAFFVPEAKTDHLSVIVLDDQVSTSTGASQSTTGEQSKE